MGRPRKYSPEVRERAVRLVFDHEHQHESQWAAIRSVAEKIGCTSETLRQWVRQAERDTGRRPGLTTEERDRLKTLERENRELKRANRSCGRPRRFSRRRSSTADRGNGGLHRHGAGTVRGRADVCGPAHRPRDLLSTQAVSGGSRTSVPAHPTGCVAHDANPPGLGRTLRRLWRSQNLAAAVAKRHPCRTLHGGALDATDGAAGRRPRAHVQDHDC